MSKTYLEKIENYPPRPADVITEYDYDDGSGNCEWIPAKELYGFLGYRKSNFKKWAKKHIIDNQHYHLSIDWHYVYESVSGSFFDYIMTKRMANHILMTSKSEKAINYFLDCIENLEYITKNYENNDEHCINDSNIIDFNSAKISFI